MKKWIINELAQIREAQTSHIGKQGWISGHTYNGSIGRITLVKTLVTPWVLTTTLVLYMVLVRGWEDVKSKEELDEMN